MSPHSNKLDPINHVAHHTLGHTLKEWKNPLQWKERWNTSHVFVKSYKSSSPIHSLYVLYILRIISSRGLSVICVFALTRLTIYIELVKHWVTVSEEIAEAILIQTIEESTASSIYSIWFLTSTFLYAQKRTKNLQKTTSIIWLAQSHSRKSYIVYSYILKLEPSKLTPTLCCNNYA